MKTIEDIVRKKARETLEQDLREIFSPIKAVLLALDDHDRQLAVAQIEEMRQRCLDKLAPESEQNAVDEFVRKVIRMKEGV
jgi:hypothetical protein